MLTRSCATAIVKNTLMADWCAKTAATQILYLRLEAPFMKKNVLNQAIAVLTQSVGLPGRFVTVWKNRTGHTQKHTPNFCNPAPHAH